ncbi:MAG: hypothetical protein AAF799_16340 [Myxococcota bacterium]
MFHGLNLRIGGVLAGLAAVILGGCGDSSAGETAVASAGSTGIGETSTGDAVDSSGTAGDEPPDFACFVERPFPYPPGSPYAGVHSGPLNNDLVPCELPDDWTLAWHALQGRGIAQPNTYSPDGETTYVTTSAPSEGDCTVFALAVSDGSEQWCDVLADARSSTIEVDLDGNLYTTGRGLVVSWSPDGQRRWERAVPSSSLVEEGEEASATGVHFTPEGHVATVTDAGLVLIIDRADGAVLAQLDLPAAYGFVAASSLGIDLVASLPQVVQDDFLALFGPDSGGGLAKFAGASGNFSDNTIAIAPDGTIYVVGGGPDEQHGALMKVEVQIGIEDGVVELNPGWWTELSASSASSPSLSADGRWLKVSDGNSTAGFIDPTSVDANSRVIDTVACDANTDANEAPFMCAEAYALPLLSGPALGATPIYEDGQSWHFEVQLAALFDTTTPDLVRYQGAGAPDLEVLLPGDRQWSSVLTLTTDSVVGTTTVMTPSKEEVLGVVLPSTADSEVAVVDRQTGELVFSAPITDDSTSTVTVGPDLSLYVTQLALLHSLSVDTRPVGGLMRFAPAK